MKKNRLDDFLLKFNGFSEKILARRAKKKKES
jgi:hypothetical protein